MKLSGVLALVHIFLLTPPPPLLPTPFNPPLRYQIKGVPYFRQSREHCGPATLAMVFKYYGVHISREELAGEIYQKKLSGSLNLDMLISARKHGFDAHAPEGSPQLLKDYIRQNVPVIILVASDPGRDRYHFMVVYGYDDQKEVFRIHSGKTRAGTIDYSELDRVWEPTGKWMMVVEQKNDI